MATSTKSKTPRVRKPKAPKAPSIRTIRLVRLPGAHLPGKLVITEDGKNDTYLFERIRSEIGGQGYRMTKVSFVPDALGELEMVREKTYDVLLNGARSTCDCPWGTYGADKKPCRHVAGLTKLVEEGKLS